MIVSDDFMPLPLAERVHGFLDWLPASAWNVWYGTSPWFRFHHLQATHSDWCRCAICVARQHLESPRTRDRLASVLGIDGLDLGPLNVTWYAEGDHLAVHTDEPNGDYAFIWYLTKEWDYAYGGNLHVYSGGREEVEVPSFNRFVVLDVADSRTPHRVSRVSAAPRRRLAISGWYRCSS